MDNRWDTAAMAAILIIAVLVLTGPLAILFGADSRELHAERSRAWWPGAPRR
jgi:hypothetical protein